MPGREKRKRRKTRDRRRQGTVTVPADSAQVDAPAGAPRKSKDDIAREKLVPLEEGERPTAVTVAAVVAGALVLAWIVAAALGDSRAAASAPLAVLLGVAAWGMWRSRYWAVLGFQVLLAFAIVTYGLSLMLVADRPIEFAVLTPLLIASAVLFWRLVKSLARLQMPQRHPPS
jgi:hypothetical protein